MTEEQKPWWEVAFQEAYELVYAHRDDGSAAAEVAGVLDTLTAVPGPVLDACCGNGRHLEALRQQGAAAFGFDLSPELLKIAQHRSSCQGQICRADMRALPFQGPFAGIALFFTAFGYFNDDDNVSVLKQLAQLLKPGGHVMLDLPHAEQLRPALVPSSERTTSNGTLIKEKRYLTGKRVEKQVELLAQDGRQHSYTESVRLYDRDEFPALAQQAGLCVVDIWSSLKGPSFDDNRSVVWLRSQA